MRTSAAARSEEELERLRGLRWAAALEQDELCRVPTAKLVALWDEAGVVQQRKSAGYAPVRRPRLDNSSGVALILIRVGFAAPPTED